MSDSSSRLLSRFGFRTAASGSVRMRMNVVHQAEAFSIGGGRGAYGAGSSAGGAGTALGQEASLATR